MHTAARIKCDVAVIGAGAAGMMAAAVAGKRGRSVRLFDHASKPGEKIRISGGGRCNFTNLHTTAKNFISANPHFCKSALARYRPADFIALVERYGIAYHEKTLGQLFCDGSSRQIVDMLLAECAGARVEMHLATPVSDFQKTGRGFSFSAGNRSVDCASLIVATGGLSIPRMGATGFGYDLARQFGLDMIEPRPALVPFLLDDRELLTLAGITAPCRVAAGDTTFDEAMLITHRGLSGPAMLQISSYWQDDAPITIDLLPGEKPFEWLKHLKQMSPKLDIETALAQRLSKRLAQYLCRKSVVCGPLADLSHAKLAILADLLQGWTITPTGTEGYRTAEVTFGGVDTAGLSSQTMEANAVPGLYFIGEVVDVTGHLGGHNFQWAWASGYAAGSHA